MAAPLLLIIESPGKIKKITEYCKALGHDVIVKASFGHIRELANKGQDDCGFDIKGNAIESYWEISKSKSKNVSELKKLAKGRQVILATDGDREGESIAWHLSEVLKLKSPDRIVYQEITKDAIKAALAKPRKLDLGLVGAALGRAHLDKLVGYAGSKRVVWKLNIGAKSMGRVQSAALWLLVQREMQIRNFKPQNYFSLSVAYKEGFKAFYCAAPKPVGESTAESVTNDSGEESATPESDRILTQAEADKLVAIAQQSPHQVTAVDQQQTSQKPPAPFTTSTLQQAAGTRFKLSPDQTMALAQTLYEQGLITYMRTDSVALAAAFTATVQQYLTEHDPERLPQKVSTFSSKDGAQEAHEAIRPTDVMKTPVAVGLEGGLLQLYTMVWQRTVATQCAPALLNKVRISIQAGTTHWQARGQTLASAGYSHYWANIGGDALLPNLQAQQGLTATKVSAESKQTKPPGRFTEPTLVQTMEQKGVGRPSTYASTIATLKDREYITLAKGKGQGKIEVTAMGLELMKVLDSLLPGIVRPTFTAEMEAALDEVAKGKLQWERYLTGFQAQVFEPALLKAEAAIKQLKPGQ